MRSVTHEDGKRVITDPEMKGVGRAGLMGVCYCMDHRVISHRNIRVLIDDRDPHGRIRMKHNPHIKKRNSHVGAIAIAFGCCDARAVPRCNSDSEAVRNWKHM